MFIWVIHGFLVELEWENIFLLSPRLVLVWVTPLAFFLVILLDSYCSMLNYTELVFVYCDIIEY